MEAKNVFCVVTKMDTIDWQWEIFDKIKRTMVKIAKQIGIKLISTIPIRS